MLCASDCKLYQFTWFSLPSIFDGRTWGSPVEEIKDRKGKEIYKMLSPLTEIQGVWRPARISFHFRENHPFIRLHCFPSTNDRHSMRSPKMPQKEEPSLLVAWPHLRTCVLLVSLTLKLFPCLCWLIITPGKGGHGEEMGDATSPSKLCDISFFEF